MIQVHIFKEEDGYVSGYVKGEEQNQNCVGMLLPEDHDFFDDFASYKINENGELIKDITKRLNFKKQKKIEELKNICTEKIINGFEYGGYQFGFSTSDQSNITSTMMAMQMGILTEIEWTVRTLEGATARIILNKEQFEEMCRIALTHKDNCIKHLRNNLELQINACTSLEQLSKITWEGVLND